MDAWLREMDSEPTICLTCRERRIHEYVSIRDHGRERWATPACKPPGVMATQCVLAPTLETTRCATSGNGGAGDNVLLLGGSGTAKTSTAYMFFDSLDAEKI